MGVRSPVVVGAWLLCCSASAFVFPCRYDAKGNCLHEQRIRWPLPQDTSSTVGLGRSLTFWVDPAICDTLRPRFVEYFQGWRSLVTCEELHDTIGRALSSWSANNRHIAFYNVSHKCAPWGALDCSNSSDPAVEIRISARSRRLTSDPSAVAVTSLVTSPEPPLATNNQYDYRGETIRAASIELVADDDMCWYLDTATCSDLLHSDSDI